MEHKEITIGEIDSRWPETYMIEGEQSRYQKYQDFYFGYNYRLLDLRMTDMLMLHNSWTPEWYKQASRSEVLFKECTLSNILRELV